MGEWEQSVSKVKLLLTETSQLTLERKRLAKLKIPAVNRNDTVISSNFAKINGILDSMEELLSEFEGTDKFDQEDLKKYEQELLNLNNQYQRLFNDNELNESLDKSLVRKESTQKLSSKIQNQANRKQLLDNPLTSTYHPSINETGDPLNALQLNDSEHLQMHSQIMENQDAHLDILSNAISRQKELGLLINGEIETHIQILEETEERVDRTAARLGDTSRRLDRFRESSSECGRSCGIISVLVVILFIIVWIAKRT